MTEPEWLACTDPQPMLEFLRGKASDRKLRLFAVACCRSIWHLLSETRGRDTVEVGEHYADRVGSERELAKARRKAQNAWTALNNAQPEAYQRSRDSGEAGCILITAVDAAKSSTDKDAFAGAWSANSCAAHAVGHQAATLGAPGTYDDPDSYVREELIGREKQYDHQCQLLHDIFGSTFRPIALDTAWLTPTVLALAQTTYDNRRLPVGTLENARLAVLADALEEAGCNNPVMLDHLRGPGQHVRGCWVVDLLLGKE